MSSSAMRTKKKAHTQSAHSTHTNKVCDVVCDLSTGWRTNVFLSLSFSRLHTIYLPFRYYARKVLYLTKRNMCVTVTVNILHELENFAHTHSNIALTILSSLGRKSSTNFSNDSGRKHFLAKNGREKFRTKKENFLSKHFNVCSIDFQWKLTCE